MAVRQHTPRLAHTQTAFVWRFIALSTTQPRVITIEATSEQEARQQSPAGCVMIFAARIRQEVCHA
ncbi:host cell division inhibitor Icd-like protein [Shigella sonnei]|nr:host cell division inhibitor Icd-like protein [Shigella sonnei]EFX9059181.1 host cell division inhibitor Icd-like protein [Shigella sonnei]EFX9433781.1 host cell division inhibitor Icd-like protein [Shigella sonnei]EFX9693943.1 host cell division inhibitor Icd-like protein [Shigella sonnei]EFX9901057.1 host cell division inhibitor Icd-like protein [Shigella sonnei]